MARRARLRRWAGTETCPHCAQRYVYELEVRCEVCDGPLCPICAVREVEAVDWRCPDCPAETAEGTG
jgi:hypothetical protein